MAINNVSNDLKTQYNNLKISNKPLDVTSVPKDLDEFVLSQYKKKESLKIYGLILAVVASTIGVFTQEIRKENKSPSIPVDNFNRYKKMGYWGIPVLSIVLFAVAYSEINKKISEAKTNKFNKANIYKKQGFNISI